MKKELKDFIRAANNVLEKYIEDKTEDVIQKNPEEYYVETTDYGHYNNGVGFDSCGGREDIYNTTAARERAIDEILDEIDNVLADFYSKFADDEKFVNTLYNLISKKG